MRLESIWLANFVAGLLIAQMELADQPAPARAIPSMDCETPRVRADDVEEPEEDPERVERLWNTQLVPAHYRRALEATGQGASAVPAREGTTSWQCVGPTGAFSNVDWNGRMTGIHIREFSGQTWYFVGACSGGLWFAYDSPNWASIGDLLPNPSVRAFAVHPNPLITIVGTGDWRRYAGAGMYRTTTGGATWEEITLPVDSNAFFRIHYLPTNPDVVLAACGNKDHALWGGILRSTSGGDSGSWSFAQNDTGGEMRGVASDLVLHPTNPSIQYACMFIPGSESGRGVYKSVDAGATWTLLSDPVLPSGASFDRASVAICRDFPQNLALVVEDNNYLEGVFKSTNDGDTWSNITGSLGSATGTDCDGIGECSFTGAPCQDDDDCPEPGVESCIADNCFGGNQIWHAQAIAFRPNNPQEIYVGAIGLARTLDGGDTWQEGIGEHGIDIGHVDITQLYFSDVTGDDVLWILNDGGIYRHDLASGDTNSWNGSPPDGLQCSQIYSLDAERSMITISMQDNGNGATIDTGVEWKRFPSGDGSDCEITDPLSASEFYASGQAVPGGCQAKLRRLTYSGEEDDVLNNACVGYCWFDRLGDTMFSQAYDGTTRQIVSQVLPATDPAGWTTEVLVPAPPDNSRFFGSYLDKTLFMMYFSSPIVTVARWIGGEWDTITYDPLPGSGLSVQQVCPSLERLGESWMSYGGTASSGMPKLLHTTDYGQNWNDVSGLLSAVGTVYCVAVVPFASNEIYVGTDIGIFRTLDGGTSWEPFQEGMPIVVCSDLRYIKSTTGPDTLVAATFGRGVWRRDIDATPAVYVDDRNDGFEDGTIEYPHSSFESGVAAVPPNATLALHGDTYAPAGPVVLSQPMTIVAYESPAVIDP